jgi:trigger factor
MKADLVDVTETRKSLVIELPPEVVDAEIQRIAENYARSARIPGFRPGKTPTRVVRQRFKEQILHDVAHELVPRAVDEALSAKGLDPVDTPDVTDVVVEEGKPLTFTAAFETVPPIDPGDYDGMALRKRVVALEAGSVDQTLERLRQGAARFEPVDDRRLQIGDWPAVDLDRRVLGGDGEGSKEHHDNVTIELGASANPPGFDQQLLGLEPGASKTFTVDYPADQQMHGDLAGKTVEYDITLKGIKRRVLPELDDEFAKDLGAFGTLDELRERIRQDLLKEVEADANRDMRSDLLAALARRIAFEVPTSLVERELDRRMEELARRMVEQRVDPRKAGVDWKEFRQAQRDGAVDSVKATLVLDEIARRENVAVVDEDIEREVSRFAAGTGRTPAAVRAQLEKDAGLARLATGLRREKTVELLVGRANISMA